MLRRTALGVAVAIAFSTGAFAQDATPASPDAQSAAPPSTNPVPGSTPSADAMAPPPSDTSQPSPSHLAAATDLLIATNAKANAETMIGTLLQAEFEQVKKDHPDAPEKTLDAFRAAFSEEIDKSIDGLLTLEAQVYAEHFSEDELRQLSLFYRSEVGQRYLSQVPLVMKETTPVAMAWGRTVAANALRKAIEKLQKNGVTL